MSTVIFLILSIVIAYVLTLLKSSSSVGDNSAHKTMEVKENSDSSEFKTDSSEKEQSLSSPTFLFLNDIDDDDDEEEDYLEELDDVMDQTMKYH